MAEFTDFFRYLFYANTVYVSSRIVSSCCEKSRRQRKRRKISKPTEKLSEIIGLESVKEEINQYMKFIKEEEKYRSWNVKIPRGILLTGPPGTGKTLLVKAMANSLGLPIICAVGSEFIEKYVGVGASRVRSLFDEAREKSPCIVFIDEIDAIGSRANDDGFERASTLNQLLTEMDGFEPTENILIFAATNLIKKLDKALLRSGRFDKKIYFDLPNDGERKLMFKLYLKNMVLPESLSLEVLSERTAGMSGADIANIVNQAKINAIQDENKILELTEKNVQKAIDEVMIGREKRERLLTRDELKRVAHHEAGHALLGYLLKDSNPPIKVSIIPRGEAALGFSQPKPENKKLLTEGHILSTICVLLGGRCAEKIIYGDRSTGASDDIEKITALVQNYLHMWGMSKKLGPLKSQKGDSKEISKESRKLVGSLEKFAEKILKDNKNLLERIAIKLLKQETIILKDIHEIIGPERENSLEIVSKNFS